MNIRSTILRYADEQRSLKNIIGSRLCNKVNYIRATTTTQCVYYTLYTNRASLVIYIFYFINSRSFDVCWSTGCNCFWECEILNGLIWLALLWPKRFVVVVRNPYYGGRLINVFSKYYFAYNFCIQFLNYFLAMFCFRWCYFPYN